MIDTLRATIATPFIPRIQDLLRSKGGKVNDWKEYRGNAYKFLGDDDWIRAGSYSGEKPLRRLAHLRTGLIINFRETPDGEFKSECFQVSLPRRLYGHNVSVFHNLDGLIHALVALDNMLAEVLVLPEWQLYDDDDNESGSILRPKRKRASLFLETYTVTSFDVCFQFETDPAPFLRAYEKFPLRGKSSQPVIFPQRERWGNLLWKHVPGPRISAYAKKHHLKKLINQAGARNPDYAARIRELRDQIPDLLRLEFRCSENICRGSESVFPSNFTWDGDIINLIAKHIPGRWAIHCMSLLPQLGAVLPSVPLSNLLDCTLHTLAALESNEVLAPNGATPTEFLIEAINRSEYAPASKPVERCNVKKKIREYLRSNHSRTFDCSTWLPSPSIIHDMDGSLLDWAPPSDSPRLYFGPEASPRCSSQSVDSNTQQCGVSSNEED